MNYFLWGVLTLIVLLIALNIKKVIPKLKELRVFFEEVSFEMTKVTWPTREEVINSTVLVLVVTIILVIMIGVVDSFFGRIVQFMF